MSLGDLGSQLASSIKGIIIDIVDFLTPIVTVVGMGMALIGLLLYVLRQEFYGVRLIIGGAVTLIMMHLIVPIILSYL